jgi:hypothetical protein
VRIAVPNSGYMDPLVRISFIDNGGHYALYIIDLQHMIISWVSITAPNIGGESKQE